MLITEGQTVPVGDPIAIIGTADETIEEDSPKAEPAPAAAAPQATADAESPVEAAQQGSTATSNGAAEPAQQPAANKENTNG